MYAKLTCLFVAIFMLVFSSFAQKESELSAEAINKIKEKFWLIQNNRLSDIQKEKAKKELDQILVQY